MTDKLCRTHTTVLLAPAIVGLFDNADLPDRINPRHSLTDKYFNLPQLGHYLFRLVSLVRHL